MTKFTEELGALSALLIALLFPLVYGLFEWCKERKLNLYSGIGIVSVVLTGVIGVFALPAQYLAYKEAGLPLLIGLVFLFSSFTKKDATAALLGQILDLKKIDLAYRNKGFRTGFAQPLFYARCAFIGSFLFSAIANYILAIVIVTAAPSTPEFTEQIGKMTAFSFPVIALPVMLVLLGTVYFLFWHIERTTKRSYMKFLTAHLHGK